MLPMPPPSGAQAVDSEPEFAALAVAPERAPPAF
jgi:hypothetical protein